MHKAMQPAKRPGRCEGFPRHVRIVGAGRRNGKAKSAGQLRNTNEPHEYVPFVNS
jgi:hypothetical protein